MTVSAPKEELHRLVDRLPEQNTDVAREFLLWLAERETPDAKKAPRKSKKVAEWPGTSLYRLAGLNIQGEVAMRSQDRLQQILAEYRQRLEEVLAGDLDSLILYGSQARGDAEAGSDIDVLCLMKNPFDYGELVRHTAEAAAEVSLKYNVVISTAFVTRADYLSRRTPFLMNVRREGVTV